MLTGYGFRLWSLFLVFVLLVLAFARVHWWLDLHRQPQPFSYWQAMILSVTAFHGRVFPSPFTKDALEAICGLVIEVVFIAMLTQRFFNR